jgi:hypothetical protein
MQSSIKVTGIKETIAELKKLDPDLLKQMRKDIKNEPGIVNAMSAIKSKAPSISPLKGMMHGGRTGYGKPRVATSFRPGTRLDRAKERSIVTINTTPPKNAIGFQIIDMVGRGKRANSAKAKGMARRLGGQPSRYVWKAVENKEAGMSQAVVNIIDDYSKKANVRLRIK